MDQIESIQYDYLPGERESRRVWFITFRFPPLGVHKGDKIIVNSFGEKFPAFVDDIHGRSAVIIPLSNFNFPSAPTYDPRPKGYPYKCTPMYPRVGKYNIMKYDTNALYL